MKKELLAAVDLGTSYVKSGVYNLDGECIAGASEAVKNERPSPGIFIQHGEELVDSVIRCIRKIAEQIPERMKDVEAVAFTGQMAGFMGVDKDWNDVTGWSCSLDTRFAPYAEKYPNATFVEGKRPWEVKADIALPCATQNELNGEDAQNLIKNDVLCIGEISNMGCTPEAIDLFIEHKKMYAPGKAVNAGGVATSGLEMSQNAMHLSWSAAEVDEKLHTIMHGIHTQCVKYGTEPDGYINYVKGANIAGFMKVAHAMMGQGVI